MWHVKDVGDVILIVFVCNAMYVEGVEDRSNTPKGCNAMYVGDVWLIKHPTKSLGSADLARVSV